MTKRSTITVRGQKVSNRTQRRYMVVEVREHDRRVEDRVLIAYAQIVQRSDKLAKMYKVAEGYHGVGIVRVVIDTTTGEEV